MHDMLLDHGGINWVIMWKVRANEDDLWLVEIISYHKARDADKIEAAPKAEGYIEAINPSPDYRKQIEGEIGPCPDKIVRVKYYDGVERYYRYHGPVR